MSRDLILLCFLTLPSFSNGFVCDCLMDLSVSVDGFGGVGAAGRIGHNSVLLELEWT